MRRGLICIYDLEYYSEDISWDVVRVPANCSLEHYTLVPWVVEGLGKFEEGKTFMSKTL